MDKNLTFIVISPFLFPFTQPGTSGSDQPMWVSLLDFVPRASSASHWYDQTAAHLMGDNYIIINLNPSCQTHFTLFTFTFENKEMAKTCRKMHLFSLTFSNRMWMWQVEDGLFPMCWSGVWSCGEGHRVWQVKVGIKVPSKCCYLPIPQGTEREWTWEFCITWLGCHEVELCYLGCLG